MDKIGNQDSQVKGEISSNNKLLLLSEQQLREQTTRCPQQTRETLLHAIHFPLFFHQELKEDEINKNIEQKKSWKEVEEVEEAENVV